MLAVKSKLLEDRANRAILHELMEEPSLSIAAVGRRVGLSAPSVRERLQKLYDVGVITGSKLEVDPAALGYPVLAFVRVRPGAGLHAKVVELARGTKNVLECHRVTGDDCFLMKVTVTDLAALEPVLEPFLVLGQTSTALVQSTPVPARSMPILSEIQN
jgi:Lrp/AsnC family leucine-responsive transcriptional regulator